MPSYINTDIYYSDDGDFILSAQKDLESTATDPYRSLLQSIRARLNHRRGEWPGRGRDIGANLSDFHGKPNTEEIGDDVKLRVINELTKSGFISINDLFVDVIPVSKTSILIKIRIRTSAGVFELNTRFSLREDFNSMSKGQV